jgi:glycosyltransferase involved in cell wall biosynthesis
MPVFNGEEYLGAALDSLLAQTYSDFEIIISDNASSDGTESICADYLKRDRRIRYYRQPQNVGAAPNYNRTFHLSRGDYFKWHAHDDICKPKFLELCVSRLEASPESVLCYSKTRFIDAQGHYMLDYDPLPTSQSMPRAERFLQFVLPGHIILEIFGVIRAKILKKTPLIASFIGSDQVLLAELGLYGSFIQINDYLFYHREHQNRSIYSYRNPNEEIKWWDTSRSNNPFLPTWRQFMEHLASLMRVPLTVSEWTGICFGMLRRANWQRRRLFMELLNIFVSRID